MNKKEILTKLSKVTNNSYKDCEIIYDNLFEIIKDELSNNNDVTIKNFGTFKKSKRKARNGFNPNTLEPMKVSSSYSVSFRISNSFKEKIN